MRIILKAFLILLGVALFVGCAAKPRLEPRSAVNSQQVNFTGSWELRTESGEPLASAGASEEKIWIPRHGSQRRPDRVPRGQRSDAAAVHVFIETGRTLKITQTDYGIFVSFDRAVVEEFTFGEYRTVSIGPIEAQRASGWEGDAFVVETMDSEGVRLEESWSLAEDGKALVREIAVVEDEKTEFTARQVFDRA